MNVVINVLLIAFAVSFTLFIVLAIHNVAYDKSENRPSVGAAAIVFGMLTIICLVGYVGTRLSQIKRTSYSEDEYNVAAMVDDLEKQSITVQKVFSSDFKEVRQLIAVSDLYKGTMEYVYYCDVGDIDFDSYRIKK